MSEQPQHPSDPQAPEGDLLNETAEDQAADKAPRPPEPPALPHAVPQGMGTPRVLATLPTGELLFLAAEPENIA